MTRFGWFIQIDNREASASGDIGNMASQRDMTRTVKDTAFIPGYRTLEEIIAEFTVGKIWTGGGIPSVIKKSATKACSVIAEDNCVNTRAGNIS